MGSECQETDATPAKPTALRSSNSGITFIRPGLGGRPQGAETRQIADDCFRPSPGGQHHECVGNVRDVLIRLCDAGTGRLQSPKSRRLVHQATLPHRATRNRAFGPPPARLLSAWPKAMAHSRNGDLPGVAPYAGAPLSV